MMAENALVNRLRRAKNALVPVNVRQFVSHLVGNVSPLTEAQFTPTDLAAIRYAIAKRGGGASGSIGYGDYGDCFSRPREGLMRMLYKSYTNPAYRMETTLGRASYKRLLDGSYVVEDRYNFNTPPHDNAANFLRKKGVLIGAYKTGGMASVLEELGRMYGNTGEEFGAPVFIHLPRRANSKGT